MIQCASFNTGPGYVESVEGVGVQLTESDRIVHGCFSRVGFWFWIARLFCALGGQLVFVSGARGNRVVLGAL